MRKLSYVLALASFVALAGLITNPDLVYAQGNQWGKSVKGQVVFAGNVPEPAKLNVTKDQEHCLGAGPLVSEEWVVNKENKGIKNVFVWITTEAGAKPPIHATLTQITQKEVSLDQPVCAFVPHSLAVREGQTLIVNNTAPVTHNVNYQGSRARNPGNNLVVAPKGKQTVTGLKADNAAPVSVTCNIHGWMKGWIRVYDHPYYAVTDADGKFDLKLPPAGKFNIWYWHDTGWRNGAAGNKGFPIEIKADQDNDLGKVEWKPMP